MTSSQKSSIWLILIAVWTVMTVVSSADEKSVKKEDPKIELSKEKSAKKEIPVLSEAPQGLGAFGMLLPLGQKNLDVKIPSFKDGLPSSLIRAGSMTRLDDEYMEMEKLDIRLFGEVRDKDVRVQLVTGEYHMPTQLLSSEQRSRISREDFQLEGDSMVFDTKSQQGKMTGNVKMVIFDSSSFMGAKEPVKDTKEPKPETTAPPVVPPDDKLKTKQNNTKANDKK
ncbi:hypothetical protein BH11VER1_BH11VER1_28500 [soil metagenome]